MSENTHNYIWSALRIGLGLIFLWGFFDKLFGLGFNTPPDQSWLAGSSPTFGYLNFATSGPFAGLMQGLAGNPVVDFLFMFGQLLIGLSLILGIGVTVAGYSGALLMLLIYISAFPKEFHPFMDEHVIYGIVLIGIALLKPSKTWGFGEKWAEVPLVQRYGFLQ